MRFATTFVTLILTLFVVSSVDARCPRYSKCIKTPPEIRGLVSKCDRGKKRACMAAGERFETGTKVGEDLDRDALRKRANELYQKACDLGDMRGCVEVGMYYERKGDDIPRANTLFEKACNKGNAQGCSRLANNYTWGTGVEKDGKRAATLYEKACRGKRMSACSKLGAIYMNGNGVEKDLKRATRIYRKMNKHYRRECKKEDVYACMSLASNYVEGHGVKKDLKRAKKLYKKACDDGEMAACEKMDKLP